MSQVVAKLSITAKRIFTVPCIKNAIFILGWYGLNASIVDYARTTLSFKLLTQNCPELSFIGVFFTQKVATKSPDPSIMDPKSVAVFLQGSVVGVRGLC